MLYDIGSMQTSDFCPCDIVAVICHFFLFSKFKTAETYIWSQRYRADKSPSSVSGLRIIVYIKNREMFSLVLELKIFK